MRKSISVLFIVMLMIILTACKGDTEAEINKRYMNLESFTAQIRVEVAGNKGTSRYEMFQSWRADSKYRLEVISPENMKDTVYVFDNGVMRFKSGNFNTAEIEQGMTETQNDYMLISDFLKNFYGSGNIPKLTENAEGKVVMNTVRSGNNRYRFTQTLSIDAGSFMPESLVTFDSGGNEIIRVEYIEFKINPELDETVFTR